MHTESQNLPIKGSLLLASPLLNDGIFDRSVILLTEYNPSKGTTGFILNRQTGETIGDVAQDESLPHELHALPVHLGGPVEPQKLLFAAFSSRNGKFLYRAIISIDEAVTLMKKSGTIVRAFAGRSEWSAGQLEDEMTEFMWIRTQADPTLLDFEHNERLWKGILRQISPYHVVLAEASKKPFLN